MSHKRNMILAAGLIMLTANTHAELPQIKPGAMQFNQKQSPAIGKPAPRLNLKADLVIQSMGFSQEFCTDSCSEQLRSDLGVERIAGERCSWQVTVRNIGSANSRPGKVEVSYDSLGGAAKFTGNMPAIRAGGAAMVVIPLNSSRKKYLYRNLNRPFRAEADSTNTTDESNESNNKKAVRMR